MFTKRALGLVLSLVVMVGALAPFPATGQPQSPAAKRTGARPTVALALGGGGTRGAAHVGVLKVLKKEGIPIDFIVGTSMGSIVGGLYAAGVPIETMEEEFRDVSLMHAFMTVPLWVRLLAAPVLFVPRLFGSKPYDGLYRGNKFRKYIEKNLPADKHQIENLDIPYSAVALNVLDGKPYRISKGSLGYAVQASSAVPGLRKPVEIGDGLYVDGGVVANVPVLLAKETGADVIIAVNVDERLPIMQKDEFRKPGSMTKRMLTFDLHYLDSQQIKHADIVIHPNVDGIGLISTKKKDGVKAIQAGEEAARAAIPEIKARLSSIGVAGLDSVR